MSKKIKIIIGVVVVFSVFGLLAGVTIFGLGSLFVVRSASQSSSQYYLTISEMMKDRNSYLNRSIRISGAVIGDSIHYDESSSRLSFFIADVPAEFSQVDQQGGLAVVLKNAVTDPDRIRIEVVYHGIKPDLLQNMAQAILTGQLHSDGIFYSDEILLKCPSRYEEAVPSQVINNP